MRGLAVVIAAAALSGCVVRLIGAKAGETLSAAILNQSDPELVGSGMPAYLLILDGLISQHPENPALLSAGAQLFALYGSRFATPEHAVALTDKARRYGQKRAVSRPSAGVPLAEYRLRRARGRAQQRAAQEHRATLFVRRRLARNLQATSADWTAVAELPWVRGRARAHARARRDLRARRHPRLPRDLGLLAAAGSRRQARRSAAHFERAIELSGGKDLSIKVEYARRYARLVFDQELHDRLLTEVLNSPTEAPRLTLFNVLAKQEAEGLLATSKEYF